MFTRLMLALGLFLLPTSALAVTEFSYTSQTGDPVGAGQQDQRLTTDQFTFSMQNNAQNGISVFIHDADYGVWWQLDFAEGNAQLGIGDHLHAVRYPVTSFYQGRNSLQASSSYGICGMLTGEFEVRQLSRDEAGNPIAFWVVFSQICDGSYAVLRGNIKVNVDSSTPTLKRSWGQLKHSYR